MMNKNLTIIVSILLNSMVYSQGSTLSSSPYSLFGLGVANNLSAGKTNSLGNTGIAMSDKFMINSLNPAALTTISKNQFIYDVGLKFQYGLLDEGNQSERRVNTNFSNINFALKTTANSAFGISLKPKTNVGYLILGIERPIEGSSQTFLSNINGSGGINSFNFTYAYSSSRKMRMGISTMFLFGEINETERSIISGSPLVIEDKNHYRGIQLDTGLQYDISKQYTIGFTYKTRANLLGTRERVVTLPNFEVSTTEEDLDSFKLPSEFGVGLSAKLKEQFLFNIDYKRNFWSATKQSDQIGDFVDQNLIGVGIQYTPREMSLKYWQRAQYRLGFLFDTGYLAIDENKISGYHFTAGLGLPLNRSGQSFLNISYGLQSSGAINNNLIRELYHTLTFNFSFSKLWLRKRVID